MYSGLAERLYAAEVESVFSLQLNQFVTGRNVSHENPITLDVPGLIHRVVRFDKQALALQFVQYANDVGTIHGHAAF